MKSSRSPEASASPRRGAVLAELAVSLPLLLLLFLGAVECCNMIYLKQTLSVSSYEGARAAIRFDGTDTRAVARCQEVLQARKVVNPTITLDPSNVTSAAAGTEITVEIAVFCPENSVLPLRLFGNRSMVGACTMIKE